MVEQDLHRTENNRERGSRAHRPPLGLMGITGSVPPRPQSVSSSGRQQRRRMRRMFALGAVFSIAVVGTATAAFRGRTNTAVSSLDSLDSVTSVSVAIRVNRGDSLWSLARRYGSPEIYILERVEEIARSNGMSTSDPLLPGQRVLVRVSNPVELAGLKRNVAVVSVDPRS